MTTYYADFDLTTGNNDGSNAANAWKTMADVFAGSNGTAPAAGDTVLCKGTDVLGASVEPSASGAYNTGYIKFIGVDSSWNNVGGSARAVLDGNGGAYSVLYCNTGRSYLWFENFIFKNTNKASGNCAVRIVTNNSYYWTFVNCIYRDCYRGVDNNLGYSRYITHIRCAAHSNSNYGFGDYYSTYIGCRAYNNGGAGFSGAYGVIKGCIAHDNSSDGFYDYGNYAIFDSVAYGNSGDAWERNYPGGSNALIGFRAASNTRGINVSGTNRPVIFYYYGDNTTETSGYYDEILNNGASTVTLNGTDTNEGFVDPSNDDYNLRSDATYRRVAVSIP